MATKSGGSASDRQRRAALAVANFTRSARAALKRQITKGTVDAAELIAGDVAEPELEEIAGGIPIGQLLEAVPGVGPETARAILDTEEGGAPVPSDRALYRLRPRTRRAIARRLGEHR